MAAPGAQITICGALKSETIAALVELALGAGAALLVQPQAVVPRAAPPQLRGEVVDVETPADRPPRRRALDRRPGVQRAAADSPAAAAQRALVNGPLAIGALVGRSRLTRFQVYELVRAGVLVATGNTSSRRYELPGKPAKEAP